MKIWVIGRNYPLAENQMKGSFELEQAKMLAKRNDLEVAYLAASLHPKKKIKKAGFHKWFEDGVTVFSYSRFFLPRVYPFYFVKLRDFIWLNFLRKVQNQTGLPDVIHVHYPVMMMLANVLEEYKAKGVKIVVTEHWSKVLFQKLDKTEQEQLIKYTEISDSFICVGPSLKKSIIEMTGKNENIVVVPNIVNNNFLPCDSYNNYFNFIAVGRLVKLKQFDKIIIAFSNAFNEQQEVKLTIVGGGEEETALKCLVKDLGLDNQVIFTGSLSRERTARLVGEANCLICYSLFETFGVPIIEAWACGIPTICSSECAILEQFDNSLGIQVSPYDIDDLQNALKYIHSHINEYKKSDIVDFAQRNYSEKVVGDVLERLYKA